MDCISLSFFECITYSFAMLGSITAVIPLLGYFKISVHWMNELFEGNRLIRFDWYYFIIFGYHVTLLILTLFVLNLNLFEIASISEEKFSHVFGLLALIGTGSFPTWISMFWQIYKERKTS